MFELVHLVYQEKQLALTMQTAMLNNSEKTDAVIVKNAERRCKSLEKNGKTLTSMGY